MVSPAIGALADRTSLLIALAPLMLFGALGLLFLMPLVSPTSETIETTVVPEQQLSPTAS